MGVSGKIFTAVGLLIVLVLALGGAGIYHAPAGCRALPIGLLVLATAMIPSTTIATVQRTLAVRAGQVNNQGDGEWKEF